MPPIYRWFPVLTVTERNAIIFVILLVIGIIICAVVWKQTFLDTFAFMIVVVLIVGLDMQGMKQFEQQKKEYKVEISHWKTKYAQAYINQLPKQKRIVNSVKIDHELQANTGVKRKSIDYLPLMIGYKEEGTMVWNTDWFNVYFDLKDQREPYMTLQRLTVDLGHDVFAGDYNVELHLPQKLGYIYKKQQSEEPVYVN